MSVACLPLDPTGCQVSEVKWPARGFQMRLDGETAKGRRVAGFRLTLDCVANQFELREFLSGKRRIERQGGLTRNKIDRYPLTLPATLTSLRLSEAGKIGYGDAAFTDVHGKPPARGPTQHLCLFALKEKRFKNRKPFPIIFEDWSVVDASGRLLGGTEAPPPQRWSQAEYHRLGLRFFEAIVVDDPRAAWELLSGSCRKRLGKAEFRRRLGEYRGCARRFGQPLDQLRRYMFVNVEDDPDVVWQSVQALPADFPRASVCAQLELCSGFLREELTIYVVAETDRPCLDIG